MLAIARCVPVEVCTRTNRGALVRRQPHPAPDATPSAGHCRTTTAPIYAALGRTTGVKHGPQLHGAWRHGGNAVHCHAATTESGEREARRVAVPQPRTKHTHDGCKSQRSPVSYRALAETHAESMEGTQIHTHILTQPKVDKADEDRDRKTERERERERCREMQRQRDAETERCRDRDRE